MTVKLMCKIPQVQTNTIDVRFFHHQFDVYFKGMYIIVGI